MRELASLPDRPGRFVTSPDRTSIAVFEAGAPGAQAIVLVHGTAGDHRTWRVVWPRLADRYRLHAIDRRGRGAYGARAA